MKHPSTRGLVKLVIDYPEWEASCPWKKLSSAAWHETLLEHPEFIHNAPKRITPSFMSINQWLDVLLRHPELDAYVPAVNALQIKNNTKTTGKLWGKLLCRHPQFAKYALWKHLRSKDWVAVLSQQPQFIGNYENERKQNNDKEYTLDSSNIAHIIACQPSLFEHFRTTEFSSADWRAILFGQPQLWDECDFHDLNAKDLGQILARYPQWLPRCDTDSLSPNDILVVADVFPEILNHYDLERFREIGYGDTPWMEKHRCLVPYSSWHFSYEYWDALLTRLSSFMGTGKRPNVSSFHIGLGALCKQSFTRFDLRKPPTKNVANSFESIMDFRFWIGRNVSVADNPDFHYNEDIIKLLMDKTLSYEQLMLKMSMLPEEDCGLIFYGLFIQKRHEITERIFGDELPQVTRMVPLQYLLPISIMHAPFARLNILLREIYEMDKNAIADFRDKAGNNALHCAFFRTPWHPETQKAAGEFDLISTLVSYGVNPDAPNNMGYSYRQISQGLEKYLSD